MDWAKTTAWGYRKHLSFGIWCDLYKRFYGSKLRDVHTFIRINIDIFGKASITRSMMLNPLRPKQNGRLFADDTFKRIFLNENIRISIKISLKFVHKGLINNIPASVLIMAWRRPGDKPLSEPMLVRSLTHICVTRPQWVKYYRPLYIKIIIIKHGVPWNIMPASDYFEILTIHDYMLLLTTWFQLDI